MNNNKKIRMDEKKYQSLVAKFKYENAVEIVRKKVKKNAYDYSLLNEEVLNCANKGMTRNQVYTALKEFGFTFSYNTFIKHFKHFFKSNEASKSVLNNDVDFEEDVKFTEPSFERKYQNV